MNAWFETVAEAQRRAKKRLPKSVYGALIAGSERGQTIADNERAFTELGFAPHVAGPIGERDQSTTVLGQQISMPVLISPTGVQAVHPDGEVAVAPPGAAGGGGGGGGAGGRQPRAAVVAGPTEEADDPREFTLRQCPMSPER
ncbi:alpha-hydroxy-acid oxidizing protein, partial [Nocardia farcinica]|uniref:alpha-hydroxy-acid oxidizing protein n=1 Tax=Nocardia farcinica TaxID=37329 RepID=UPI0024539779